MSDFSEFFHRAHIDFMTFADNHLTRIKNLKWDPRASLPDLKTRTEGLIRECEVFLKHIEDEAKRVKEKDEKNG